MKSSASYENITYIFFREEHSDRRFSFLFSIRLNGGGAVLDARFFDKADDETEISKAGVDAAEFEKLRGLLRGRGALEIFRKKERKRSGSGMPRASDAPIYKFELGFSDGEVLSSDTPVGFGGELKQAFAGIAENAAARANE